MEVRVPSFHLYNEGEVEVIQAFHNAIAGMHASAQRLDSAAARIAGARPAEAVDRRDGNPGVDIAAEVVEARIATHGYKANAAVLSVAQEMSGMLLDRKA